MIKFAIKLIVLAVPLLLIVGPSEAATKKLKSATSQAQMSEQEYAARERCINLAQKEPQSGDEFKATGNRRSVIYTDCIRKAGYKY